MEVPDGSVSLEAFQGTMEGREVILIDLFVSGFGPSQRQRWILEQDWRQKLKWCRRNSPPVRA